MLRCIVLEPGDGPGPKPPLLLLLGFLPIDLLLQFLSSPFAPRIALELEGTGLRDLTGRLGDYSLRWRGTQRLPALLLQLYLTYLVPLDRLQIERLEFGKVTTGEWGAANVGIGLLLPPLAIPPLLFVEDLLRIALGADPYLLPSFNSKF